MYKNLTERSRNRHAHKAVVLPRRVKAGLALRAQNFDFPSTSPYNSKHEYTPSRNTKRD